MMERAFNGMAKVISNLAELTLVCAVCLALTWVMGLDLGLETLCYAYSEFEFAGSCGIAIFVSIFIITLLADAPDE